MVVVVVVVLLLLAVALSLSLSLSLSCFPGFYPCSLLHRTLWWIGGAGLSFVDQANLKSQKLASSANRAGTDWFVVE
jgi:hypothetical protein